MNHYSPATDRIKDRIKIFLVCASSAAMILGTTACSVIVVQDDGCMPPTYEVSSPRVGAGQSVIVSAPDATCNPRYGDTAQIQIQLLDSKSRVRSTALAPMGDGGAFSYALMVPVDSIPGDYQVSAQPYDLDWCDDTGRNNRVNSSSLGSPELDFDRVSCGVPFVELIVIK